MALPKRRHSPARRDKRRASNWGLRAPSLVACPDCRAMKPKHQACPNCGNSAGQKVMKGIQERVHRGRT